MKNVNIFARQLYNDKIDNVDDVVYDKGYNIFNELYKAALYKFFDLKQMLSKAWNLASDFLMICFSTSFISVSLMSTDYKNMYFQFNILWMLVFLWKFGQNPDFSER